MHFLPTDDQLDLQRGVRKLLDDRYPLVRLAAASPIQATPVPTPVDPLSPVHELRDVPAGDVVGDAATAQRLRRDGAVLTAALQVGLATRMTELAVAYAKEREQFGRTIG